MNYLLIVILLVVLVTAFKFFGKKNAALDKIPGPPRHWFFGNFFEFTKGETGETYLRWIKNYGPIVRYKRLWQDRVIVSDPAIVKHILLNSHLFTKQNELYQILKGMLGDGILTLGDEDLHKKQRGIMTPAFAYRHIKGLVPIFSQKAEILRSQWLNKKPDEPVDVRMGLSKATSDVIGEAAFSYTLNSLEGSSSSSVYEIFKKLMGGKLSIFELLPIIKKITPVAFRRREAIRDLNQQVESILNNKISQRKSGNKDTAKQGTKKDLLDLLIECENENGESLSYKELAAQSKTFLLAGYETSSTALVWATYALSTRPEMQDKLAEEVFSFVGKDGVPNEEDVEKMPYLDRVVKETLRWRSPVPMVVRTCAEDTMLGNYLVPAGTLMVVHIYAQHHNPLHWDNPEEFDPDRWLDLKEEVMFSGSYIPFLLGPRNCIGSKFAQLEIKIILAMLVQKLKFSLVPGQDIKRSSRITMLPSPNVMVYMSPRN